MRPRSAQLEDLKTHYSVLRFSPTAESAQQTLSDLAVESASVTGSADGTEVDVPAKIFGTVVSPFPILAGNAISVALNTSFPVTVTFTGTDITIARVVSKINAAVGITIAHNVDGYLYIIGVTKGDDASITLADVSGATLAKLGLIPGVYTGTSKPTRGIITLDDTIKSNGGLVVFKTIDQKNIVVENPYVRKTNSPLLHISALPLGSTLHGRIKKSGSNYEINYLTKVPSQPEVVSFNSNVAILDGTDSFNIAFTVVDNDSLSATYGELITVNVNGITFPAPPYTRDQVIARINQIVASTLITVGSDVGKAVVFGQSVGPLAVELFQLSMKVDGGAVQSHIFSNITSLANIAAEINANFTGVTASGIGQIKIVSDNTNGYLSSIEILHASPSAAQLLEIPLGLHRGTWVIEPYGPDEIRISPWTRGALASLTISGGATTLQRLGLTAGTYFGTDDSEESVVFPELNDQTSSYEVVSLIPEVLELFEVQIDSETINNDFNNKIGGNGRDINSVFDTSTTTNSVYPDQVQRGVKSAGKPVLLNPIGQVDRVFLSNALDEVYNIFRSFSVTPLTPGSVNTVLDVLLSNITAGTLTVTGDSTFNSIYINGSAYSNFIRNRTTTSGYSSITYDLDYNEALVSSKSQQHIFRVSGNTADTTNILSLSHQDPPADPTDFPFQIQVKSISNKRLAYGSSLFHPFSIFDNNTVASGSNESGKKYLAVTGVVHQFIRVNEAFVNNTTGVSSSSEYSLLEKINARFATTVGDGITTYGEFNGNDAIQQAIDHFTLKATAGELTIFIKKGTFTTPIIDINAGVNVRLIGSGSDTSNGTKLVLNAVSLALTSDSGLYLENLNITSASNPTGITIRSTSKYFIVKNCQFVNCYFIIEPGSNQRVLVEESVFTPAGGSALLTIRSTANSCDSVDYAFRNCDFGDAYTGFLSFNNNNQTADQIISGILFEDCKVNIAGPSAVGSGILTTNYGLVNVLNATGLNSGLQVEKLTFRNCDVIQTASGVNGNNILIFLVPRGNNDAGSDMSFGEFIISGGKWLGGGINTAYNPITIVLDDASSKLTIEKVEFGFTADAHTHGGPLKNHERYFARGSNASSHLTTNMWGAIALRAGQLIIRDIELINMTGVASNSGDLFIYTGQDNTTDINGVSVTTDANGGGAASINRVRLRNYLPKLVNFENVRYEILSNASGSDAIVVEPNAATTGATTGVTDESKIEIKNCFIRWTGTGGSGIITVSAAASGDLYTDSPLHYANLHISNNTILKSTDDSIQITSSSVNQNFENIKINDNVIRDSAEEGIILDILEGNGLVISDNVISNCDSYGIRVVDRRNESISLHYSILNNTVIRNNTADSDRKQVSLVMSTAANKQPRGIILGNECSWVNTGDSFTTTGSIRINAMSGGVSSAVPDYNEPRGAWTGTLGTSSYYSYDNALPMALNSAVLRNNT